ncbi:MAG: MBL fold metallo-hydrolase [Candidatus Moranbacteria bacterium]|nr:MBL fold metallo-hydrolase [Candidatus Moranbacteria bacterium]
MKRHLLRLLLLALVFLAVALGVFAVWAWRNARMTRVVFLDVGQGDAILVSHGSDQILIDGGRSGTLLLSRLSRYVPFWDRTIETVVMTHPDADHIGGLPDLLRNYRVGVFAATDARSSSDIFALLQDRLAEGSRPPIRVPARTGLSVGLPEGGTLSVAYPPGSVEGSGGSNEGSVVSRFTFGDTDFLLTGDLPEEEKYLSGVGEAEVLKVSHHGSKHSSSQAFLDLVRPKEAVVSVGKNSYGHPDADVLARLASMGAVVRRTDREGDIVYRCDTVFNGCVFSGSMR